MRFNDASRTIVAQLPPLSYAEVRAVLEARVKEMGADGETPLDQRLADALVSAVTRGPGVRARPGCPWWWPTCPSRCGETPSLTLPGELERGGLISADVVRRLLCDATWWSPSTTPRATPCTKDGPGASERRPAPRGLPP